MIVCPFQEIVASVAVKVIVTLVEVSCKIERRLTATPGTWKMFLTLT
jgi:hypothetical protein